MPGIRITYQGAVCASGEYYHTPGLQPGQGYVLIAATEVALVGDQNGIGDIPDLGVSLRTTAADDKLSIGPVQLHIEGDLVLEDEDDVARPPVVVQHVFLAPGAGVVQDGEHDDTTGGLWRVALTDVRAFWGERGTVTGRFNVLRASSLETLDVEGIVSTLTTGKGCHRRTKTEIEDEDRIAAEHLEAETLAGSGERLWTARELVKRCLSNLPGRPQLNDFPDAVAPPLNIVWDAERSVTALARLLEQLQLVLEYRIDGTVAVHRAEGAIPDLADLRSRNPRALPIGKVPVYRPGAVEIIGGQTIRTVRTSWLVPVCEADDGRFKHVGTVLREWGYDYEQAMRSILAARGAHGPAFEDLKGGTEDIRRSRISRAKRDIGRAYQVGSSFCWPIRDRAEMLASGRPASPVVLAARFRQVPLFDAFDLEGGSRGADQAIEDYAAALEADARTRPLARSPGLSSFTRIQLDDDLRRALLVERARAQGARLVAESARDNASRAWAEEQRKIWDTLMSPYALAKSRPTGDGVHLVGQAGDATFIARAQKALVDGVQLHDLVRRLEAGRDEHKGETGFLMDWQTFVTDQKLAGIRNTLAIEKVLPGESYNEDLMVVPADEYDLDPSSGIVRFKDPAVVLMAPGTAAPESAVCLPARVDLLYGIEMGELFRAYYTRTPTGFVVSSREGTPPGAQVPFTVRDEKLIERITEECVTAGNRALFAAANDLARRALRVREVLEVVRPELEGFHLVEGAGVIGVGWVSDGDTAQTKIGFNSAEAIDGLKLQDPIRVVGQLSSITGWTVLLQ